MTLEILGIPNVSDCIQAVAGFHLTPLFTSSMAAPLSWRPRVYKANTAIIWPSTKEACQHLAYDHCLLMETNTTYE